jgi:hypothetical protein
MQAENFIIEPAGVRNPGAGHLHIIVDAECSIANQDIPKDETHLHFADGQLEADLELAPGTHTLCLQAGDGYHTALWGEGMTADHDYSEVEGKWLERYVYQRCTSLKNEMDDRGKASGSLRTICQGYECGWGCS